eukprot:TRINITY_DN122431_c0_g1_i1.p1 TRINITY_DN122431_c0_g1~~TRINITY_DN122431_c0_g1_i1.p1  ORF type:complete len:319 (-),score=20.60 TRINITY_DN122431_c0_g1_i1:212-1168(-)
MVQEFITFVDDNRATKAIQLDTEHGKGPIELFDAVMSVVIPRIASWLTRNSTKMTIISAVRKLVRLFEEIKTVTTDKAVDRDLYLPYLLIALRGLIDDYPDAIDVIEYLGPLSEYELSAAQAKLVKDAKDFFEITINSGLVKYSLKKFIEIYKLYLTVEEAQAILRSLKYKFIKNKLIGGMTGFSRLIAVERSIFFLENLVHFTARFVGLSYHEGAHVLLREGLSDYFANTPPSKFSIDSQEFVNLEAGYCLESLLMGHYDIKYWHSNYASEVIDLSKWSVTYPILIRYVTSGSFEKRGKKNPHQSAFCEETLYADAE